MTEISTELLEKIVGMNDLKPVPPVSDTPVVDAVVVPPSVPPEVKP